MPIKTGSRNIVVKNLGVVSDDEKSLVKFILLDNGILLFGRVKWHKDLLDAYREAGADATVVAAGIAPKNIGKTTVKDDVWGGWQSTGYGIITPDEYKGDIKGALKPFEQEINRLWSPNE